MSSAAWSVEIAPPIDVKFVLSLFPFCIFLAALAAYFGGEALAKEAVAQLFQMAPAPVAEAKKEEPKTEKRGRRPEAAHGKAEGAHPKGEAGEKKPHVAKGERPPRPDRAHRPEKAPKAEKAPAAEKARQPPKAE